MKTLKKKMGRPRKQDDIPIGAIEALCQFNPTKGQVLAGLLLMGHDISEATLDRLIKDRTGNTFEALRNKRTDGTRLKLIQNAIAMANNRDRTMLIFCLKNLCGWGDGAPAQAAPMFQLNYSPEKSK
jgi:hypothetical protein